MAVHGKAAQQPASGRYQRHGTATIFEVRGEESGVWLVLDGKRYPPRVICSCLGWNAPKNAALIVAALEAYSSELYSRFPLNGSARLNEQSAVKPSGEVESVPEPKPAARKPRARHRG